MGFRRIIRWTTGILAGLFAAAYILVLVFTFHIRETAGYAASAFVSSRLQTVAEHDLYARISNAAVREATDLFEKAMEERTGRSIDRSEIRSEFHLKLEQAAAGFDWNRNEMRKLYREQGRLYRDFDIGRAANERNYIPHWIGIRLIDTMVKVIREIRVNAVANITVYMSLFLTSFFGMYHRNHIPLAIAVLLSVSTIYLYFIHQDWISKLLQQEFGGYAYLIIYFLLLTWILYPGERHYTAT